MCDRASHAARTTRALAVMLLLSLVLFTADADAQERLSGAGWTMSLGLPKGQGPFPAVILLPGCSGNAPAPVAAGLRDHARRLIARGYAAGTLDVLGGRSICADLGALGAMERRAVRAAKAAAKRLDGDRRIDGMRIGFLGQSFGGSVALRLASAGAPFRAVAAYYPWCADGYGGAGHSDFRAPVLIMTGGADIWTPVARCKALKPAAGSAKAQIVTYSGAVHSFDLKTLKRQKIAGVGGSYPVGGDRKAAASSQDRFIAFFDRQLQR